MKKILTLVLLFITTYGFGQNIMKVNIYNMSNCPVSFTLVMSTLTTPGTPNCTVSTPTSAVIQIPPGGTASYGYAGGIPGLPPVPPGTIRYFLGARILNGPMGCSGFLYYNSGLACAGMSPSQPVTLRGNNCSVCNPNLTATWTVVASNLAEFRVF